MNTVLVAGSWPIQNQAWRNEFVSTGQWDVLGPVQSVGSARVWLQRGKPSLVVCDLRLVDGSAVDLTRFLRTRMGNHRTRVLVVGREADDPLMLDALVEGADSFHDTGAAKAGTLAAAAREVLGGGADIPPWMARQMLRHFEADRRLVAVSPIDEMVNPLALSSDDLLLLRQLSVGYRLNDLAAVACLSARDEISRLRTIYRKMQWDQRSAGLTLAAA